MKKMLPLLTVAALAAAASTAVGQTVDGSLAGDAYGLPVALQDTQTNFGDNTNPDQAFANGSELDGAYATIADDTLFLLLTGNLESNFNKLELFIDSVDGGQNTIDQSVDNGGTNPNVDFDALQSLSGLTFDDGFDADYYFTFTGGNDPYESFANYAVLGDGSGGLFLGGGPGRFIDGANDIDIAIDNSNILGVGGGNGTAAPGVAAAVTTGIEFAIPLAALGNPSGDIAISAFINGSGHDFLSNQVLGGIGGGDNLGAPSGVDFGNIAGDQFFAVAVPEPTSLALLGLGGIAALRRRR